MHKHPITEFIESIQISLADHSFVSLSLNNYKGTDETLKAIHAKPILIKREPKVSVTYRHKTRDIVKNYTATEALELIEKNLGSGFKAATLYTNHYDLFLNSNSKGTFSISRKKASQTSPASLTHDHQKKRAITPENKPYLQALRITDDQGNVFKNAQDKYRQINHYIELISPLINEIPESTKLSVVDMGSGKGYLTFALYDYLTNVAKRQSEVTGVEFRTDLVDLCNQIAKESEFTKLSFVEGTIEDYENNQTNVLIALHACDTATDDAISKGIKANADLIVVAPCCHKQIRREIEKNKVSNDLDFLTRYGIFMERQAEMVTDGIRALILEYFGYKTKVFQFISDAHTPKNVMIVGVKSSKAPLQRKEILNKIQETKDYFGIEKHHLEKAMGI